MTGIRQITSVMELLLMFPDHIFTRLFNLIQKESFRFKTRYIVIIKQQFTFLTNKIIYRDLSDTVLGRISRKNQLRTRGEFSIAKSIYCLQGALRMYRVDYSSLFNKSIHQIHDFLLEKGKAGELLTVKRLVVFCL